MDGATERTNGRGKADGAANGKQREASLTPPPDVSPERRAMAVNLVHQTFQIPSSFGIPPLPTANHTASASGRVTRSTRNSATPAFGLDVASTSTTALPPAASGVKVRPTSMQIRNWTWLQNLPSSCLDRRTKTNARKPGASSRKDASRKNWNAPVSSQPPLKPRPHLHSGAANLRGCSRLHR